jgi:hypothetical protein
VAEIIEKDDSLEENAAQVDLWPGLNDHGQLPLAHVELVEMPVMVFENDIIGTRERTSSPRHLIGCNERGVTLQQDAD